MSQWDSSCCQLLNFELSFWLGAGLSQSEKMLQILSDFGIVTINIYYEEQQFPATSENK